eukprot:jgi/Botrbrau1/16796/Bobra.150_2s0025.1
MRQSLQVHHLSCQSTLKIPKWIKKARSSSRPCGFVAMVGSTNPSSRAEVVVGIDLGTTNSAVGVLREGRPAVVQVEAGRTTVPSVVYIDNEGLPLVGTPAQRKAVACPLETFYSVKRFIGRKFADVENQIGLVAYKVEPSREGMAACRCVNVPAGQMLPQEVSAEVVKHLVKAVEADTGCLVRKAVISVPAYFTEPQRQATIEAGKLAGLEIVRLLREPVAAALAYGVDAEQDATILVLDLGGGTFDVSLLEVGGGVIEVLATGGDPFLGGDDWDIAIVNWLLDTALKPASYAWNDPKTLAILRRTAEAAKIKLSSGETVAVKTPVGGPGGGPAEVILTRQLLEKLTADLYRRAALAIDQACWQAGVDLEAVATAAALGPQARLRGQKLKGGRRRAQFRPKRRPPVSQVLLVGGGTRMPAFRRLIKNMTGMEPQEYVVDPDEAVALGAAVQAGMLEGSLPDMMVMDVWQAGLLRALATHQLRSNPEAASKLPNYDLKDMDRPGGMDLPEDMDAVDDQEGMDDWPSIESLQEEGDNEE